MQRCMEFDKEYLCIPIQLFDKDNMVNQEQRVTIYYKERDRLVQLFELMIPIGERASDDSYPCDYYANIRVGKLINGFPTHKPLTLVISAEGIDMIADHILCVDKNDLPVIKERRPKIHFTADTGWINDPNGLVYADGIYHMYFQYNPFHISWQNMSWGHAISKDLLHWEQLDTVMLPDENGTIFSGSGLRNDKEALGLPKEALLFFYSAAGDGLEWSRPKEFTQRIAYSLDGGNSLIKLQEPYVDTISFDNRDPKVYWHEETKSYFMVLWIVNNDFGILTSKDLCSWELTDRFALEDAWECPDLFKVLDDIGKENWIFTCADGYYYFGDFDGEKFKTDQIRHKAYINKIQYAAQSYSGIEDRIVFVPWLRVPNDGRLFTGAMALPKELSVRIENGNKYLIQKPIREFYKTLEKIETVHELKKDIVLYSEMIPEIANDTNVEIKIDEDVLTCDRNTGKLIFNQEEYETDMAITKIEILLDDNIFEVWLNGGIMTAAFSLNPTKNEKRKLNWEGMKKVIFYKANA